MYQHADTLWKGVNKMPEQILDIRRKEVYKEKYGFFDKDQFVYRTKKGLSRQVVEEISHIKNEPDWMRQFRLRALDTFLRKPMPNWGGDLSRLNFDDIYYYIKPADRKGKTWDEVPDKVKQTFEKLGIPEAERKFLAGVEAQYDCLTADTMVFTNPGAVPISQIQLGQFVYSLDINSRHLIKQRVLRIVDKGELPVFEVTVAGRRIKATFNHPFLALIYRKDEDKQRGHFEVQWRYLSDLQVGDYIAIVKQLPDEGQPYRLPAVDVFSTYTGRNQISTFSVHTEKLFVRQQKELNLPEYTSESLMWFLGAYIGDGWLRRRKKCGPKTHVDIAFPVSDQPCRQKLADVLKEAFGYELRFDKEPYRVRIRSVPIARLLSALGLDAQAKTKSVPAWFFSLPRSQKLAFIGGYIDSDGHVRGDEHNSDATLTSANEALLRDVQRLAVTCGLRVSNVFPFCSKATYKGETTERTAYRLMIMGDLQPLISYSVKVAAKYMPKKHRHRYNTHRHSKLNAYTSEDIGFAPIQSIRYLGIEPTYDIEVEGTHNFVAEGIVVHNSEVVYGHIRGELNKQGVIFCSTDEAVKNYPDIVRKYFGTVIPFADNKFAALNSATWSGGSFIYIPEGVHVEIPLQAYFRINSENAGQFERTLIIAEPGSFVHYIEGCTAPVYALDSLHSAVVEIIVKEGARVRYTTIQNWSDNVYNLVTKRAVAHKDATMEWIDGNFGCLASDSKVFLNNDIKPISEVKPGDVVYSVDGDMCLVKNRVLAKRYSGKQQLFHMQTENYREIKATANHPFLTLSRKGKHVSLVWKRLDQLTTDDLVAIAGDVPDSGVPKVFEPILVRGIKPITLPNVSSEELMWLLGVYLGDGYVDRNRVYFAVPPKDQAHAKLTTLLGTLFNVDSEVRGSVVRINSAQLRDWIIQIGLGGNAHQKRVPLWVYGLPKAQRIAFIEGYIAADGYKRKNHTNVSITSANRPLLEDIKTLAISCGLDPRKISRWTRREKKPLGKEEKEYTHYFLYFGEGRYEQPVHFSRITAIEPLGVEDTWDLEIANSHNFIADGFIVHNSRLTMKYPSIYLIGKGAHGEVLSVAYAGDGQHQDAGGKAVHAAPYTSSIITSKSISKGTGRTSYRGLLKVHKDCKGVKSNVRCDALLLDETARSDTYPIIEVDEQDVQIGHEATVSKIGEEQLFYLMSRGLDEAQATALVVSGFIEPIIRELPMEYAVELNRLIQLQMEGSVG